LLWCDAVDSRMWYKCITQENEARGVHNLPKLCYVIYGWLLGMRNNTDIKFKVSLLDLILKDNFVTHSSFHMYFICFVILINLISLKAM
jgi:hypothetical protein